LTVWQGDRLRGLFPLRLSRLSGEITSWDNPLVPAGPPLIDRDHVTPVVEAVTDWLRLNHPRAPCVRLRRILAMGAMQQQLVPLGMPGSWRSDGRERELRNGAVLEARHRRDVKASLHGRLLVERARDPQSIRDAVEEFLALDAANRPAGCESALIHAAGHANFLRTATRDLARGKSCRVDVLRIDGRAAYAAILLFSGRRAWIWQVAGHDAAARDHLAADVTRSLVDRSTLDRARTAGEAARGFVETFWPEADSDLALDLRLRPPATMTTTAFRLGHAARRASSQVARSAGRKLAAMRETYAS
jgi:hypothetical protein